MVKKKKQTIQSSLPSQDPWEGHEALKQKDGLIHVQKRVADHFSATVQNGNNVVRKLFEGFLEIVDFMFKNTCGVGSNFRLADCDLSRISEQDIAEYYKHLVVLLAYHFGCMVPSLGEAVSEAVVHAIGDRDFFNAQVEVLAQCMDHEDESFSPVKAGHLVWQEACRLLHVQDHAVNPTGRIYYQTAPGQSLIYIVEQGAAEGWLKTA